MNGQNFLRLFNLKVLVLAILLLPLIGIMNINAQELFVTSSDSDEVKRYDGTTGAFISTFVTAGSGGLDGPQSLVFGSDGNLYVCSFFADEVLRYNGATGTFIDAFIPSGSGGLLDPKFFVFRGGGNSNGNSSCCSLLVGNPKGNDTAFNLALLLLPLFIIGFRAARRRKTTA